MTVGSEYAIMAALLAVWGRERRSVSFPTIRRLGWEVQKRCNEAGIDVIVMTGSERLNDVVKAFFDYFWLIDGPIKHVIPADGVSRNDLEARLAVLPPDVRKILEKTARAYL